MVMATRCIGGNEKGSALFPSSASRHLPLVTMVTVVTVAPWTRSSFVVVGAFVTHLHARERLSSAARS